MSADELTVNAIFRKYARQYLQSHPFIGGHVKKVIGAICNCRTKFLGGRVEKCDTCGATVTLYNSCRNRHCPQCQSMKKEQWIADKQREVLPFKYFHVVFTMPEQLNGLVMGNKAAMYNLLFDSARKTLLDIARDKKYFGAEIGFFAILHTWGQKLNLHPHLHCVVPGGGYSVERGAWVASKRKYLLPIEVLKKRFRSLFLCSLKMLHRNGKIATNLSPGEFQDLIDDLFKRPWVIYLKESFESSESVVRYLARYTHKIAIGNHRITGIDAENETVSFSYKDYADNNKQKEMTLPALQFMKKFLLHVVPKRFVRIRYYGMLSHRHKAATLGALRDPETELSEPETWRETYERVCGHDPETCPVCGKGRMMLTAVLPFEYAVRGPPVEVYA